MVKSAAASAASLALSALQGAMPGAVSALAHGASSIRDPGSGASRDASAEATPIPGTPIGYIFNAKSQDVTLFDPTTRQILSIKPLAATVRWLSNEQRFWDGRSIWTYDFPDDKVQAIAVDPGTIAVARALPTGGTGPAHSLVLTPDRKMAWVNVAGGDYLAVLDLGSGEVTAEVKTGTFP